MRSLTPQELSVYTENVVRELKAQREKPLVISIMGQTGVGKSTLIRTLFNINAKNTSDRPSVSNAVRPNTKKVHTYTLTGAKGLPIVVHDMPGIGESEESDSATLLEYREHFLQSDVAIWAIHVDNRATSFDVRALKTMLDGIPTEQRKALMSKFTFILTKADVLVPAPWTMGYTDGYVIVAPEDTTEGILNEKELYYQEKFIKPFGEDIVSWTYNDAYFALEDPSFMFDEYKVSFQGLLTKEKVRTYKQRHPEYGQIFDRLYDNYRVITCSSLFKYNLNHLLLVILNKLGPTAIENFRQQINFDAIERIPFQHARELCNIRIFDIRQKRRIFDLGSGIFPGGRDERLFR